MSLVVLEVSMSSAAEAKELGQQGLLVWTANSQMTAMVILSVAIFSTAAPAVKFAVDGMHMAPKCPGIAVEFFTLITTHRVRFGSSYPLETNEITYH
jgi:hypothetical protein